MKERKKERDPEKEKKERKTEKKKKIFFSFRFLHFRFPHCHSFFTSISLKVHSLLNHLSLFLCFCVILFFLLLFLCDFLVLFNSFYHLSLPIFHFHSFAISFPCDIVLFSFLPLLILLFNFSKLVFPVCFFFFIPFFKDMHLIERFGQTCMPNRPLGAGHPREKSGDFPGNFYKPQKVCWKGRPVQHPHLEVRTFFSPRLSALPVKKSFPGL